MLIGRLGLLAFFGTLATMAYCKTVVGMHGTKFTLNGHTTYTPESGFPAADQLIEGTLLNVRAVQAIFDDAHYPAQGTKDHPYDSPRIGPVSFDYPDGTFSADRNLREFLAALPTWRKCGLLAFTVNLQGGGPTDGNFSAHLQPHLNSGFDPKGNLQAAYSERLQRVIEEADRLGMVVIVGFFYQGSEQRIEVAPDDKYIKEAVRQASLFLKGLPNRNILIEVANEVSPEMYTHPSLKSDGIVDLVRIAQETVEHEVPVSFSWVGDPPARGTRGEEALHTVDYVMFHTNWQTPEGVHDRIQAYRRVAGYDRALLINEDEVSVFNLQAATQEHVGWGYYDQGLNNYRDGFQSPPVDWTIGSLAKWIFFEQVARLSGSPIPPRPIVKDDTLPIIKLVGLSDGDTLNSRIPIEAVIVDREPRWPITRVEFFIDSVPYSYTRNAPFMLGNQRPWGIHGLSPGKHTLRVAAYDERGPAFTQICSMLELSFTVDK
jgi:hypothetical protein